MFPTPGGKICYHIFILFVYYKVIVPGTQKLDFKKEKSLNVLKYSRFNKKKRMAQGGNAAAKSPTMRF